MQGFLSIMGVQLLVSLPLIIALLIGIIWTITKWDKNSKASLFALIGFIAWLVLVTTTFISNFGSIIGFKDNINVFIQIMGILRIILVVIIAGSLLTAVLLKGKADMENSSISVQ